MTNTVAIYFEPLANDTNKSYVQTKHYLKEAIMSILKSIL